MVKSAPCPICKVAVQPPESGETTHFPFCSKRCQNVDFMRWCNGEYAIVEPLTQDKLIEHLSPEELEDLLEE
ncbi:zinc-binding protein [Polystyrenella longa]|uniref:DNA gyrase inhibitor YacG n=1 Tax=Polystyrenella longa TaxID=2528007 RepID=A0A518CJ58_9PLAN|nr:zinc-binding protein [Polystyrenella longa]